MDVHTFANALRWHKGNTLNIGGGEPTIHPKLFTFLDMALEKNCNIWMAINGKKTSTALKLAHMTYTIPNFHCKLSQDKWHQPINPEVVEEFKAQGKIHYVNHPIVHGRWKEGSRKSCAVSNKPFIKPNGDVRQCGCKDSVKIGDVFSGFYPLEGKWECAFGLPHEHLRATTNLALDYEVIAEQERERVERIAEETELTDVRV